MSIFSRRGWGSDARPDRMGGAEYERFIENERESLSGVKVDKSKPPKAVHQAHPFGERIEVSEDVKLSVLKEAAKKGNVQCQFLYGKELYAKGDKNGGMNYIRRAADRGWPDAKEYLLALEKEQKPLDKLQPIVVEAPKAPDTVTISKEELRQLVREEVRKVIGEMLKVVASR